ncbi:MAG: BrnA antitoxin family protein [Planctomycetes bacterium]|nr:BrnA antitoxin family protein [Planctomycetota bacterium]
MKEPRRRKLPTFKSERQEREFWRRHDLADYFDLSRAQPAILPNLKPTTRSISLRLPERLIAEIKTLANRRDVPYQSLIKVFLAERVRQELRSA